MLAGKVHAPTFDSAQLLREARQCWQYRITNELVYLPKSAQGDVDAGFLLAEDYNRGELWIVVPLQVDCMVEAIQYMRLLSHSTLGVCC